MSTTTQAKMEQLSGDYLSADHALEQTIMADRRCRRRFFPSRADALASAPPSPPGNVLSRVENLAWQTTFDADTRQGDVVLNLSMIDGGRFDDALAIIRSVVGAGLGMGRYLRFEFTTGDDGTARTLIGTLSTVAFDGVLRAKGIPVVAKFGGLLEMNHHELSRFTQIIHYNATTIDPIEIFIKGGMTSVHRAATTGSGVIGASFRELPASALPELRILLKRFDRLGIGGVLALGEPGRPLLDIPVSQSRVGVIVAAGLNPIAAVEESGISTHNAAMSLPFRFGRLEAAV